MTIPRILSIAGSDPSGGAGIQGDLKSIAANGGYGMAALTALTAQNTQGVQQIHTPPAQFLTAQLDSISADITIDAVKIGMLGGAEAIAAVSDWLDTNPVRYVVLDPVMVATSGDRLLDRPAEQALADLIPRTGLITPNLAELGVLVGGEPAAEWPVALDQARDLAAAFGVTVLVKGGHLRGPQAIDAIVTPGAEPIEIFAQRVDTANDHGTGCSLSAAIATRAPQTAARQADDGDWEPAVRLAKEWLTRALTGADQLQVGSGHGPLHHFVDLWLPGGR